MNLHVPKAVVAALACAALANVSAQTAPAIYGVLDLSAGRFQEPGSASAWRAESGRMTQSYLGFRGSDDLGGGLHARFGLESYIRVDAGAAGREASSPLWDRTSYVGLQGAFGTSLLGRLPTPLWTSTRMFNPFGESVGFSPSMRQYYGSAIVGDTRWNNSVGFTSPDDESGWIYNVQFNAGEDSPGATGKNVGANLLYTSGPLSASLAVQRVRNSATPLPARFDHQDAYQFGAAYELRSIRLYGQAGHVRMSAATRVKTTLYHVGAVVPVGLGFLMASYGTAEDETAGGDSTRKSFAVGYDYFLSKNTDLYAALLNERATGLASANSVAAGLRLRF